MSLPKVVLTAGDDDYASVPGTAHEIFALAGNDTVHGSGTSSIGDVIWGGAGNDTLYGARYSMLDGGSGDDRLVGTSGCRLLGGIGNDELQSSGSTQFLDGGNGNDIVTADGGHVEARGGAGNDRLDLSGSEVIADSGSGSDVLRCEIVHPFGTGSLSGGDGADRIRFDGANEAWWDLTARGGAGDDLIAPLHLGLVLHGWQLVEEGGSGNDVIRGADFFPTTAPLRTSELHGQDGDDLIYGGAGADRIVGGHGVDLMRGGGGSDLFALSTGDSGVGAGSRDVVRDFHGAQDRIDLSAIDAIPGGGTDADDAFTWRGTGVFTGHPGELRYQVAGNASIVQGDLNGDHRADFELQLDGHPPLAATDFLL